MAKTITITAPNPGFNGISAGVRFTDGKAEISEKQHAALEYFGRHRFGISESVSTGDDPELKVEKTALESKTPAKASAKGKGKDEPIDPKTATEAQAGIESPNAPAGAGDGPAGPLHNQGRDAANPDGAEPPVTPADEGI